MWFVALTVTHIKSTVAKIGIKKRLYPLFFKPHWYTNITVELPKSPIKSQKAMRTVFGKYNSL